MKTTYENPVILADYSDPDVIRVEDTYYMTASSFHFVPGLPLLVSRDLVHWKLTGYAAREIPCAFYDRPRHSKGIWAPSLRYHGGRFIITVALPDEGIFVTESADFFCEWTPLRCVKKSRGFIDPCPIWDGEKAYIVHAYAKSRIGFKSRLGIFEADPETLDCVGSDRFIFIGDEKQPTIEGPKIYRRGAFFYILSPAGGVKGGWQSVLRSFSLFGPYTDSIALIQGESRINGPHQGALVDSPSGKWYFVHFQDRGVFGRVILTEPAKWTESGALLLGTSAETLANPGEPVLQAAMPESLGADDFLGVGGKIGLQWQWQANVRVEDYIEINRNDGLILKARNSGLPIWDLPNVLSEKIVYENFTAEIEMDFSALCIGERAGALFLGGQYASAEIKALSENGFQICFSRSETASADSEKRTERTVAVLSSPKSCTTAIFVLRFTSLPPDRERVTLRVADSERPSDGECVFSVRIGGDEYFAELPPFKCSSDEWTGGRIGFFSQGERGSVLVKRVRVTPFTADWQKK